MRFEGTDSYIATPDLMLAVNAALALERPLLIKGEPGTGKTLLAYEVARALKYVPAAMLTALVLPMIMGDAAAGGAVPFNPKAGAAVLAGVVAFYTRSTLWTLGTGMAALWLLQALR